MEKIKVERIAGRDLIASQLLASLADGDRVAVTLNADELDLLVRVLGDAASDPEIAGLVAGLRELRTAAFGPGPDAVATNDDPTVNAVDRARAIVEANEWVGDLRVNMTRVVGAGRVLARALAERDWQLIIARRQAESLRARDEATAGNYWAWAGDGTDYPESLTCPVVMSARQLRELLAAAEGGKS